MQPLQDPGLWSAVARPDGRREQQGSSGNYTVCNPSTGELLAALPRCGAVEVRAAVAAADRALRDWRARLARDRADVLRRWFDLIVAAREDLATLITLEVGKPLSEARSEVDYAASFVRWFSEEASRLDGEVIPPVRERARIVAVREPVGVCAAITPWNFPAAMVTRKVAPALAAGCTMVLKPAEQTPLTALAMAELARRAGVPDGAFSVLTGARDDAAVIGAELARNPTVRKLTFTGSTAVGRLLIAEAASTVKRVSMELGGNAPFIVFDDADLDAAVEGLLVAKFRNAGQSCIGANRVLLHASIYEEFAERFTAQVRALKVGDGFVPGVQVGPMISQAAVQKLEAHVADAVAGGARVLCGGVRYALGGQFFAPTVLADCRAEMLLNREESFGPLAPLFRFEDEEECVALANDTAYGLAAYLYSENASRLWRVAERLETGMVGINCGAISNEAAPFGGVKQSGLGREGSRHGIDEFVEIKYLCWQTN